jgi:zona occludens toxin (predicted ATPase)
MKMIMIEETKLDALFEAARSKLELDAYKANWENRDRPLSWDTINDLHRAFNYHVCNLKDEIKKG